MKATLQVIAILWILAGCRQHTSQQHDRGFYYWKSVIGLSAAEKQAMDALHVPNLYIKFFDVVWDVAHRQPVPVAKILFTDSTAQWLLHRSTAVIPTVFITNECMQQMSPAQVETLSRDIHALLQSTAATHHLDSNIPEIQLDCDWTASSKDNYFKLLTLLQQQPFFQHKQVSATIRLYQCKFRLKTGIPPVQKGLLMCYNMGNLKNPASENSILEVAELEKYIVNLEDYPLPLDVALPLFDWKVLFHDGAYKGLLRELPDSLLQQPAIATQTGQRWHILHDTTVNGYSLQQGDVVRKEDATFEEVMRASRLLQPKLAQHKKLTVILYHLDSLTIHKYTTNELENMFNSFN